MTNNNAANNGSNHDDGQRQQRSNHDDGQRQQRSNLDEIEWVDCHDPHAVADQRRAVSGEQ